VIIMKKKLSLLLSTFIATSIIYASMAHCEELIDKVAAVVNNKIITLKELQLEMVKAAPALGYKTKNRKELLADKRLMEETIDQLISDILIDEEIKTKGIEVTDQELNIFIRNVMEQNRIKSLSDFSSALALQGLTMQEYKKSLKKQVQKTKIMNFAVRAKLNISEQDLKNHYMQNMEESRAPDSLHLKNIFIAANKDNRSKKKTVANKVLKNLKGGSKFESLVKKYSEDLNAKSGGDLGFLTSKDLNPEIYTAVKDLKTGKFSKLIENPNGFYIFKVIAKKKGEIRNFDEVKESLRATLTNREMERHFKSWLAELKSRSHIDIKVNI